MSIFDNDCDWFCDYCGAFMNDQPDFDVRSGEWKCKACGRTNDVSEDNIVYDYEASLEDEPDFLDIPEGCAACGGNYPDCMTSCPVFDD